MTQILKISKAGVNVVTGTAPDNLIFSSDYNTLKYHLSGTINVSDITDGTVNGTVSHNLGYVPYFTAYVNKYATPGGEDYNMCPSQFQDVDVRAIAQSYADTANVYFRCINVNAGTTTYTFRYFIFRNNLGI